MHIVSLYRIRSHEFHNEKQKRVLKSLTTVGPIFQNLNDLFFSFLLQYQLINY